MSALPGASPHRKQKADAEPLEPLFPQAEGIFSSPPLLLH